MSIDSPPPEVKKLIEDFGGALRHADRAARLDKCDWELDARIRTDIMGTMTHEIGPARDMLASVVTKLLQAGAIDLKKWVAAVDLSADRAGFIVANDLELCNEMIKAADEQSSAVPQKDRLKELTLYAVSEQYFAVRQKLGINIDA